MVGKTFIALRQLTDDRTNGLNVPFARVEELYLGPGLSWQIDSKEACTSMSIFRFSRSTHPPGLSLTFSTSFASDLFRRLVIRRTE
jgi:hypothetical protein